MVSLGCSKNLVDAEEMLGIINKSGFEFVEDESDADAIIVNTCAFIDDAKKESIDCILEMAEYKKQDKNKALVVTGCLAQRYKGEILSEMPEVDAVVGTNDFYDISKILDEIFEKNYGPFIMIPRNTPKSDCWKWLEGPWPWENNFMEG